MRTRQLICLILSFGVTQNFLFSQQSIHFNALTGPTITNVHEFEQEEQLFYISPERPYYSINWHLGTEVEWLLHKKWLAGARLGLEWERRSSSEVGFNEDRFDRYDFLSFPLYSLIQPIEDRKIYFQIGGYFNLLVASEFQGSPFYSHEFGYLSGIEFFLTSRISLDFRAMLPFTDIYSWTSTWIDQNTGEQYEYERRIRTQAFQITFRYQMPWHIE